MSTHEFSKYKGFSPPESKPRQPGRLDRILEGWYTIVAPAMPDADAPLWKREVARRGRIISWIMVLTFITVLLPFIFNPTFQAATTMVIMMLVDVVAVLFNRRGQITVAGWILVIACQAGLLATQILSENDSVKWTDLDFLCMFVQPAAIAASVLRPRQALIVFIINACLPFLTALFFPYSSLIVTYAQTPQAEEFFYDIPLTVLGVGFFSVLIWVVSANRAITRADQSDRQIKVLEMEQFRAQIEHDQKATLEHDIFEFQAALAMVSHSPQQPLKLAPTNTLSPLAIGLETWRKRALQNQYDQQMMLQQQKALALLATWLDAGRSLQQWQATNTAVDTLAYLLREKIRPAQSPYPRFISGQ